MRRSIQHPVLALALGLGAAPAFANVHPGQGAATNAEEVILALPKPPVIEGLFGFTKPRPKGRSHYLALVTREAERQGLPAAVADAVAMVESGFDPAAIGKVGEYGLMQVRPETAAMMGFKGPKEALADPEINVRYGVAYLSTAWRLAGGDLCRALMKYRAGHGEERMTPLSVEYCRRARVHLAAIGSPLADPPAQATALAQSASPATVPRTSNPSAAASAPLRPPASPQEQLRAALQRRLVESYIQAVASVGSTGRAPAIQTGRRDLTPPRDNVRTERHRTASR